MFGGVGKPAGWATILVAGGVVLGSHVTAKAADLGGDCCADLEERIAELEATTARKGNRKVKLTVYGQVNEAVMFWDDGFEQNAYVVTNDASRTRFGFKGGAKINDDWSANFQIEIGVRTANSKRTDQNDAAALDDSGFDLRHALVEPEEQDVRHVPGWPHAHGLAGHHRNQSRRHERRRQVLGRGRQRPRHVLPELGGRPERARVAPVA